MYRLIIYIGNCRLCHGVWGREGAEEKDRDGRVIGRESQQGKMYVQYVQVVKKKRSRRNG